MNDQPLTLLCLGHLRWDHVWQRPQQLMSRFASRCRVIYVDPPKIIDSVEEPQLSMQPTEAGVQRIGLLFPATTLDTDGNTYHEMWSSLLPDVLDYAGTNTIMWVSSPLADYLVAVAVPRIKLAVYDCMDDLASFRDGGAELRRREAHLLEHVDLLFTGGRSMYEARKDRHAHVHCFPSGVDVAHYAQVLDHELQEPENVQNIPHPRLGYFGVLDERIDWPLIAAIAHRHPAWHWLLVGPTAKVKDDELPSAPNVHYLGQQPYERLPTFLKSFDLATMPFALNEATRFISPTKTLEYLAGGKPVISSSVPDVVATYQNIVTIVDGADAWSAAIEATLSAPPEELHARLERAAPLVHTGSWDGIVEQMWALMSARLHEKSR